MLLETARFIKETSDAKVRLNTNGLANLIHQKDVTPLFKGLLDAVSISLNTSKADVYLNTCRPRFKEEAFPALLEFARLVKIHVPSVTMTKFWQQCRACSALLSVF